MTRPLADSSDAALTAITSLFDFVWPTAAAIWNLRWQVKGYNDARRGKASVPELRARFVEGSGIHGANLHRACLETTWDAQQQRLAEIVLLNALAIYEEWTLGFVHEMGAPKSAATNLQFCAPSLPGEKHAGVKHAVTQIGATSSPAMTHDVQPGIAAHKQVAPAAELDLLLRIYRAFKEYRNSIVHDGGVATQWTCDVHQRAANVATATALPLPTLASVTLGARVQVPLRGAVGFTDTVQRIIRTVDADVAGSTPALGVLLRRWKARHTSVKDLPVDRTRRVARIRALLEKMNIPRPNTTSRIEAELLAAGLAR